jgi:hypothetical protein
MRIGQRVRLASPRQFARLLLVGAVCVSSAATAAPETDAERAYSQGVAAYNKHDYEAARAAFAASLELAPRTDTVLNVALAELYGGHALDALNHFRRFVSAPDAGSDRVAEVRSTLIPRAESQIGRIEIDAPPGATILVDGAAAGASPLAKPVEVMPGDHVVAAVVNGKRSPNVALQAVAGEMVHARIEGSSNVATPPLVPTAPTSADGAAPTSDATPARGWPTAEKIAVIGVGSVAVVSLGLGIVLGLRSNSERSQADSYRATLGPSACTPQPGQSVPPACGQLQDANNSQNSDTTLSRDFYVVGAALAVGAVGTWLFWPRAANNEKGAWVRPMVGRANGVQFGTPF